MIGETGFVALMGANEINEAVAWEVRSRRKHRGYSQAEIAKVLKIESGAYAMKEQGRQRFTFAEVCILSAVLGIDLNHFVKWGDFIPF